MINRFKNKYHYFVGYKMSPDISQKFKSFQGFLRSRLNIKEGKMVQGFFNQFFVDTEFSTMNGNSSGSLRHQEVHEYNLCLFYWG